MNQKKTSKTALLAILSLFILTMGANAINGSIASIMAAFPETSPNSVLMLMTIGTLFAIPANLFVGWALGKRMKYRTAAVIGSVLITIGFLGPGLFHSSVAVMLVFRAIAGIGTGLTMPLGNSLIMMCFPPDKSASYLGIGNVVTAVAGMIMSLLGGALGSKDWPLAFWGACPVIITLIMSFFVPEPSIPAQPAPEAGAAQAPSDAKLNPFTWVIVITFTLMVLFYMTPFINISVFMEAHGTGGAAEASNATAIFMLGGMVIGLVNGKVFGALKGKSIALGMLLQAVSMVLLITTNSTVITYISMFLLGFGYSGAMMTLMMLINIKNHPSKIALAVALTLTVMNIVTFIIPGYVGVLDKIFPSKDNYVIVSLVGFVVLAVLYFIFDPMRQKKTEA